MRSRADSELMFTHGGDLSEYLDEARRAMLTEVEGIPEGTLLNTPVDDLVRQLASKYRCEPIVLRRDETSVSTDEVAIPMDEVPDGRFLYPEETTHAPGHRYSFHVPFAGNPRLFQLRGSQISFNLPRATVGDSEIVFSYPTINAEQVARAKQRFEQAIRYVEELTRNSTMIVEQYNEKVAGDASVAVERRRARVLEAKNLVASLGYPMKKRSDAVQTYTAPAVRKKIVGATAASGAVRSTPPFRPEPALDAAQYEDILSTIEGMALVMERSPNAFRALGEEDIRTHFLLPLNGIYEGAATGETFNVGGKTDILIRVEDKNIFIAECKFWRGQAGLTATIDQLLGYASWRDTKTAILLFNRDTAMSTVLAQVSSVLAAHPQFKRSIAQQSESRFRAVLRQSTDPDRELVLTVLVFGVPSV